MSLIQSLILSIIEGITEFLPVSSTGHLVLASRLMSINQTEFVKSFEIIIQLGAICAVVLLYGKKVFTHLSLIPKILAAFVPTAVFGFLLYSFIKQYLLGNAMVTVIALFTGGVAFIILEKFLGKKAQHGKSMEELTFGEAVIIGIVQSVSMIPGVSRAAATMFGGMTVGLSRESAVEFSFLLAIPTMAAATGLDIIKSDFAWTQANLLIVGMGFVVAFITALFAVRWLLVYMQHHTFIPFGIYRIGIALLFFLSLG